MKIKRGLAAVMVGVMGASLIACGGGGDKPSTDSKAPANDGQTTAAGESSASASDGKQHYEDNDEACTIVMGYIGDQEKADEQMIENAINEILEPELNAKLDLRCYTWGDYTQKIQLDLSGTTQLDIVPIIVTNAQGYVANGQVLDMTTLIEDYGTNIKKTFSDAYIQSPNIDGFIYGVTSARELITWEGVVMRRDLLEEAGYTVNDETDMCDEITSLDDLEEAMAKVYEKHPDMIMMGSVANTTPLHRWETSDMLTDGFGGLMNFGQSFKVENIYETDEFKDFVTRMYEWNQNGWFSKDAATTTDSLQTQMKAGKIFAYTTPMKAGAVTQDELSSGMDLAGAALYGDPYTTSYSVNYNTWGIGRNCENPARTMKVLDFIYGSPEVMNLLNWGIEGTHYEFVDKEQGIIKYAEGQDPSSPTWMLNIGWELPNQEIAYVFEGDTPEKWVYQHELIDKSRNSYALGFAYDSTAVSSQLTALNNVKNQYYNTLGTGSAGDPEKAIKEFNDALYAAGLQTVIDTKQEQFDAWVEAQGGQEAVKANAEASGAGAVETEAADESQAAETDAQTEAAETGAADAQSDTAAESTEDTTAVEDTAAQTESVQESAAE